MAANTIGLNQIFPIYNEDGTPFHNLVLRKSVVDSIVMSLGDKITGDVFYKNNTLQVTMKEYVEYNGIHFSLVNPPTIVREGMVADNGELKGMTKYSFEFYHPMCQLSNFPFTDVATKTGEEKYLSQNKTFSWIGKPQDYIDKLNKNLQGTVWYVRKIDRFPAEKNNELSDVLTFDNVTVADAIKTGYETWDIPYVVSQLPSNDPLYAQGKRFVVEYGLPSNEIYESESARQLDEPFVFHMGQGVGLKNNSRTPRNNKIVTRIAGYGSEDNVPYGYPQIIWYGNQDWDYTINNNPNDPNSYPIYKGIVGGQYVKLIKHPFTRTHLMPSIYSQTVFNKVSPYLEREVFPVENTYQGFLESLDSAIQRASSEYEVNGFTALKTTMQSMSANGVATTQTFGNMQMDGFTGSVTLAFRQNGDKVYSGGITIKVNNGTLTKTFSDIVEEVSFVPNPNYDPTIEIKDYYDAIATQEYHYVNEINLQAPSYESHEFADIKPELDADRSTGIVSAIPLNEDLTPADHWDDSMDDDGKYLQTYFQITLPQLDFDLYACAAITQEMQINMRSGACIGCTFPIQVDWDDYKRNFYDEDGNFVPDGEQRDLTKYPKSNLGQINVVVQKDNSTFGTLMPNIYKQPKANDLFVFIGISLPTSYISNAEQRLDDAMKTYMLENNVYYFDYPLKFDEHFLATHTYILEQIRPNSIIHFDYGGVEQQLFVKQLTVKYENAPLPQYDITLTDNIEVVLNQIGQVADDVEKLSSLIAILRQSYNRNVWNELAKKLSKTQDDTAQGFIRFMQGLQVGSQFVSGILGEGGVFRKDADGKTYIEADKMYVRMKAYFDSVEIREYQHTSGNRIASQAKGFTVSRVEWLDASGNITDNINNVVKFRCYWRAKDDEHETQNQFVVGDQAFMEYSDVVDGDLVQKRFWRVVVGRNVSLTEGGEAWIDLSNKANDTISYIDHQGTSRTKSVTGFEPNSSIPQPEDDICQLGNVWDTERQGAIIEYVSGGDAPSYQIFQGIDSFSLNGKDMVGLGYSPQSGKAYMNVYGDAYIGDPNGTTFVKYEQRNSETHAPKLTIKADVDIQSTFGGQTLEERVVEYAPPFDDTEIWAEMANLQDQIDGAIETYYMTGEPSLSLPPVISTQAHPYDNPWLDGTETPTERTKILNNHVGDLYYDKATGRGYRFMYDDENQVFLWTELTDADVAEALRVANDAKDTADGKRTVYSTWGAWIKSGVNTLEVGDLFIPTSDTTQGGVTYKAKKVYKCTTDGTNAFEEINYTDDSALNTFKLNQYVQQLINGTISSDITTAQNTASGAATAAAAAQGTADSAAAAAAALGYLSQALGQDTAISGGLVLSTLIGLRDGNGQLWSGINGAYQTAETGTGYKGHGIAAWYGGAMVDKEVVTTATDFAKSLFRFDGSGYLASGNITWDKNGIVTIANVYSDVNGQPVPWSGATLQYITNLSTLLPITIQSGTTYLDPQVGFMQLSIQGKSVATQEWVGQNYVSISFFERLFQAYNGTTQVHPNSTSTIDNIKAMFGFWTEQYLSALGQNSSGGGGGDIDMTTVWTAMANNTTEQINLSHLTTALSGYATQAWVGQQSYLTSISAATSNALGGIKVGYTTSGKNYKVQLDSNNNAYVNVPWTDNNTTYTNGTGLALSNNTFSINSTYQTYISHGESAYNSLGNYLPLSGGVINANNAAAPLILKGGVGGFREGLRIVPASNGWADLVLCGTDAAEESGTSENTWFFGNNNGNFYITRNGSTSGDAVLSCVNNAWSVNGNTIIHSGNIGSQSVSYASSAGSVAWSNVSSKPSEYAPSSGSTYYVGQAMVAKSVVDSPNNQSFLYNVQNELLIADYHNYWYVLNMGSYSGGNYRTQLTMPYDSALTDAELFVRKWYNNEWTEWRRVCHSGNSSVSLSGSTLTVKINGTSQSLSNTWRGIQNNLTSTSTDDSLSAYQGYLLANGSARDNTKLPLTGGTLSGDLGVNGQINLNRGNNSSYGRISFYTSSYYTWYLYMSPSASYSSASSAASCPTGGSVPVGSYVTGWGLRSLIQNSNSFGWTWESSSNTSEANPSIMMELSSHTGNLKVYGTATATTTITCSCSDNSAASVYASNSVGSVRLVASTNNRGVYIDSAGLYLIGTDGTDSWLEVGNVGIGVRTPSYKLHVSGSFRASGNSNIGGTFGVTGATTLTGILTANGGITIPSGKTLTIGDAVLSWDSTNQAIKITKGFYSETFISALGANSSSGGGGSVDMDAVWSAMANNTTEQINLSHLTTALASYATQAWVTENFNKYVLPTASSTTLGGVKVGTTLAISSGVLNLPTTGVTAGTYKRVTVDAYGRVTSGDNSDADTDTWRGIYTGGTSRVGTGIDTKAINFAAGSNVSISFEAAGTASGQSGNVNYFNVKIAATDTTYTIATGDANGQIKVTPSSGDAYNVSVKGLGDRAFDSTSYLPLAGGTMSNTDVVTNLNADLLDGLHASSFGQIYRHNGDWTTKDAIPNDLATGFHEVHVPNKEYSSILVGKDYGGAYWQLYFHPNINYSDEVYYRKPSKNLVRTFAFTDSNVASATTLQTARTINGTSFDGSANITTENWGTARNISIADSDSTNTGTAVSVNGSAAVTLKLPSTIKATLSGNATSATKATNDSDGNAINSTYLKKSGGTMTGTLGMTCNTVQMNFRTGHDRYNSKMEYMTTGNEAMVWANKNTVTSFIFKCGLDLSNTSDWTGITPSLQIKYQSVYINSLIASGVAPAYNLYVNGTFYASGDSSIGGTLGVTGKVTANAYEGKYLMSSNVVYIGKASDVVGSTGGCFYAYGKNPLYFYTNANNRMIITGSGDIGIGTSSPSYKLDVSGVIHSTTGIFSDGYVSALGQNTSSDIRKKDIKENIALSVEDIAAAPMIKYEWKDNRDLGMQVGSIAQYWESVLPESIHDDKDGFKSMQYGVISLLSTISVARKVQDHERRIKELEKECERLRFENEQLRMS